VLVDKSGLTNNRIPTTRRDIMLRNEDRGAFGFPLEAFQDTLHDGDRMGMQGRREERRGDAGGESSASSPVRDPRRIRPWSQKWDDTTTNTYQTAVERVFDGHKAWNDVHRGGTIVEDKGGTSAGVVKMGRRQGWIHFLALDASKNVCIDTLLGASRGEHVEMAQTLLRDDCKMLKDGLSMSGLLLGRDGGVSIFWDDDEPDFDRLVIEEIPIKSAPRREKKPKEPVETPKIKSYPDFEEFRETNWGAPPVEVTVVRILGAPFLDTVSHDSSIDQGPGEYVIRARLKGGPKSMSRIGLTGGMVSGEALRISNQHVKSAKDVLYLEIYKHDEVLEACGSVMISELQRLAVRSEALGQEPPPSLLKQLISPTWRKKDPAGSMIWVKLVAKDGSEAGHVLLEAKAKPGDVTVAHAFGPSSEPNSDSERMMSGHAPEVWSDHDQQVVPRKKEALHHGLDQIKLDDNYGEGKIKSVVLQQPSHPRKQYGSVVGGYLQANARHVYDVILDCALKQSGCDKPGSSLELLPEWSWLTSSFATRHGIREEYATLSFLHWILNNHIVKPNSMCFEVITAKYLFMKAISNNSLESHEVAMYTKVRQDIKSLLNGTFENYFALKQNYEEDVEYLATRSPQAATVMRSAIKLLKAVLDGDDANALRWMSVRFNRAANKRFYSILASIEARIRGKADGKNSAANSAFKKAGDLCRSIVEEIRADECIQHELSSSDPISIAPQTSLEYCKGISAHLKAVLTRYPPRKPTEHAVLLVQAIGNLQDFLERHHYTDAAIQLNSFEVFRSFILHWISSSSASLQRGIQIIDDNAPPEVAMWRDLHENKGNMVVPFAEVLLRELQKEMETYKPILAFWPSYTTDIEAACVDVLRLAVSVASKQCGLVQSAHEREPSKRCTAWKWVSTNGKNIEESVTEAIRNGTSVPQALLMNTLRRLLAVVPQIESAVKSWCQQNPDTTSSLKNGESVKKSLTVFPRQNLRDRLAAEAPNLGALWAQLVKELRTEYYATITLTAESLSRHLTSSSSTSVYGLLKRAGLEASSSAIVRRAEKALDHTSPTLHILSSVLDSRVFVALTRGLWDLTAKQILNYAENLTENGAGHAWRGRQNAAAVLSCLENFYKHEISTCMGTDLQSKDLAPPQHFQRASALLENNSTQVDKSFDVY
jgi:hypothetical protein